ncbi:polysaccharide lyase 6 family protein [Paraflavitalea sp. CAU 1676]|uniref:polysaccharide lyase 6 family protein n=1 Tax=Paraflavitalea sp. CAU 1676 TaxID=3032598 RepID=UPI0023DC3F62|nr:polysaccharide lyase 6 family protein [Paraflavitalea sp. CAU 1676]MDF2192927.1 polysaccharide lyase 6 family protein [Paraflavitalea sp. CAU 1676]
MKCLLLLSSLFYCVVVCATDYLASTPGEAVSFLQNAVAGDRVLLKDGIYRDAVIQFVNNGGTREKPVSFLAQTPGKVSFEGNSSLAFGGRYIVVSGFAWRNGGKGLAGRSVVSFKAGKDNANYSSVQDCLIDDYNNENLSTDNKWVSLFGEHNTLTRCLLKSKRNLGATVTVWLLQGIPARHLISHNYFLDRLNGPDVDNGLESIRIGDSKTSFTPAHCIVAFNRFENCDGEIEIISNKSCHNSYLHNTFVNSDGGLTLRHGNDCLADGNFFDGTGKKLSYGIRFIGEGHVAVNNCFYHLQGAPHQTFRAPVTLVNGLENTPINGYYQVKRATVAGNLFVNCDMPAIRIGAFSKRPGMTLGPDSVVISNNLVWDDEGKKGAVLEELTPATYLTANDNLVAGWALETSVKGFDKIASVTPDKVGAGAALGSQSKKGNGAMEGVGKESGKSEGSSFEIITTGKSVLRIPRIVAQVAAWPAGAGADWIEPAVAEATKRKKFTRVLSGEVGPAWLRNL